MDVVVSGTLYHGSHSFPFLSWRSVKFSIFASFHFRWSWNYFPLLVPANIVGSHGNRRLCTPEIVSISNPTGMQTGRQTFLTLTFSEIYHYRILRLPITNQTWSLLSMFFSDLVGRVGRGCWEWLSNVCLQRLSGWGNRAGRRSWPSRRLRAVGIHTGLATKMSLWSVLAAFLGIIQMYFHWHTHTHTPL